MVLNDTRVLPVRMRARRASGGAVEVLLLEPEPDGRWQALARPARRLRDGETVTAGELAITIERRLDDGRLLVRPHVEGPGPAQAGPGPVAMALDRVGEMPLPPYIRHAARRPAALPDRVRPPPRVGRRSHRRPALHAGPARAAAQPPPGGRGDARRRPRHVPARDRRRPRRPPAAQRGLRRAGGDGGCRRRGARRRPSHRRGRHHHRARARDGVGRARARPAAGAHAAHDHARAAVRGDRARSSPTSTCRARRCSRS